MKRIVIIIMMIVAGTICFGQNLNGMFNIAVWQNKTDDEIHIVTADKNEDGLPDYRLYYDSTGEKITEELDFNFDGSMDDFYFYSDGVLHYRQIDSNYDDFIDIWVYLSQGVYITKFERDTDFDGEIDYVKDYDQVP